METQINYKGIKYMFIHLKRDQYYKRRINIHAVSHQLQDNFFLNSQFDF